MSICTYIAPNGEKSLLAAALEQKYGPDITARLWNYARANMDKFDKHDANGEPLASELETLADNAVQKNGINPDDYRNHSGGAGGTDEAWDQIGRKNGFNNHNHYREPGQNTVDSATLKAQGIKAVTLDAKTYTEGKAMADRIDRLLGENPNRGYGHYRYRNYGQVKYSDAIFAISSGLGIRAKAAGRPFMPLDRGTAYAIMGAILDKKPVYVFDQKAEKWYTYDATAKKFVEYNQTPVLTKNYAGVGTRSLLDSGRKAIQDVFDVTLGNEQQSSSPVESTSTEKQDTRILQNINGKATLEFMDRLFVPTVDVAGNKTGNFSPQKQAEAVNTVLYLVQRELNKSKGVTPGFAILHALRLLNAGSNTKEYTETRRADFRNIVNSFAFSPNSKRVSIAELAFSLLESYGLKINNKDHALRSLEKVKNSLIAKGPGADTVELDIEDSSDVVHLVDDGTFTEEEGETLQNFNDISFQLDPRDTASWRMKMFLATLEKKEYATYKLADKPDAGKREYTPETITKLKPNEVFVFGSNAEGVHGKGAALTATQFGAVRGISEGPQGQSYAVITKKNWRVTKSSTLAEIQQGLSKMLTYATTNPSKKFLVTKLGSSLAGYSITEIKQLFKHLKDQIPDNVILPEDYEVRPTAQASRSGIDVINLEGKVPNFKEDGPDLALAIKNWIDKNPDVADKLARFMNRIATYHPDAEIAHQVVEVMKIMRPIAGITNHLGMPELANFNATYESVLSALADSDASYHAKREILLQAADTQPMFSTLVKSMDTADESLQNEFVKVMNLHATNYTMTTFNHLTKNGEDNWILNSYDANRASQIKQLIANWAQAQKVAPITVVKDGQRVLDTQRMQGKARSWLLAIDAIQKQFIDGKNAELEKIIKSNLDVVGKPKAEVVQKLMDYKISATQNILALHGIHLTTPMVRHFLQYNPGAFDMAGATPRGLLAKFIWKAGGNKTGNNTIEETDGSEGAILKENNPIYTEPATMKALAQSFLAYSDPITTSSFRNAEGKTIFTFTLNTALTHRWRELASMPTDEELHKLFPGNNTLEGKQQAYRESIIDRYNKVLIAKDNYLLRHRAFENGRLSTVDGLKSVWSKKGVTRAAMSDREQALLTVSMFQNRGKAKAGYISLAHSDKTTTPTYENFPKIKIGGGSSINATAIDELYKVFLAEYDRVRTHWDEKFNHAKYEAGKRLFFLLPQFNYEAMQARVDTLLKNEGRLITQKDVDSVWNSSGGTYRIHNDINSHGKKLIRALLVEHIDNLTNSTLAVWEKSGIIDSDKKTHAFDKTYVGVVLKNTGYLGWNFDRNTKSWKDTNGFVKSPDEVYDAVVTTAARDYATNYFLVNTSMAQLFFGDPAEATKGKGTSLEIVDTTMKEYAKRLAKDIAPGQDLHWNKPTYQSITLADVTTSENYIKNAVLRQAYNAVDATDAQELVTVQEHLDMMFASGVIKKGIYDEMSAIVEAGKGKYYEFVKPEHLVVMQPSKPVFVGKRAIDRGTEFNDYIKSSSYALYPPLTHTHEIDELRKAMENKGIARANFESAHKLGSPIQPAIVFNPDGTFNHAGLDGLYGTMWADATQTLNRSGFRIQQEVPYDEEKEAIKTVTQMNTLIAHAITLVKAPFFVEGFGDMTGSELRAHKEDIRRQLIDMHLQKFYKDMGMAVDDNGTQIWHKDKVLSTLADEARKRGYSENEISALRYKTADGELDIPLMFSTAVDKFESLMMSMIKDIVNIKMPGKSYVQASSVGYVKKQILAEGDLTDAQRQGIVYIDGHDSSQPLRIMDQDESGKTIPAQVLAPFNFMVNGIKANIKDYLIPGTNTLDSTKIPKELLQLVGARIPNQGHNSMLAIEIVGFVPDNLGDLIIVPSGITKQMGADFDVDKLYTYRRPYKKSGNGFAVDTLTEGKATTEAQLKTQYFDTHWAVLTHPEMYDRVLQPLDKSDLADENKLLAPKQKGFSNYFDVQNQINDFQSGKYAKTLVASTSLSVVFNTVIQNKSLQLSEVVSVVGKDGKAYAKEVPRYININGLKYSKLSGYGTSRYKGELRTKQDNLTTLQSAAVDNAKNRTLDNLNLTPDTYPAVAAMMMLETDNGEAMDLTYATRLLAQPVIKEFSKRMNTGNDSMSEEFIPNLKEQTIKDLKDKLTAAIHPANDVKEGNEPVETTDYTISTETLPGPVAKNPSTQQLETQLAAISLFAELDKIGSRIRELQSLYNQTTNGAGPNLLTALDKVNKLNTSFQNMSTGIMNEYQLYENTEQGNTFEATIGTATSLLTQLLPYNLLDTVIEKFKRETLSPNVSVDVQKQILRGLRSFVYASTHTLWNGASDERRRLMFNTKDNKSLARRVMDAQNTWGANDYFLQRLNPVIGDLEEGPDAIEFNSSKSATYDDSSNTNALMQLLNSADREQKLLAEDLVQYAFLTGGLQDATSFISKVPVSYLVDTEFSKELREMTAKLEQVSNSTGFFTQFIQHSPERAVQIKKDAFSNFITPGQTYPNMFIVDSIDGKQQDVFKKLLTVDTDGTSKYPDFLSYRSKEDGKFILYKLEANGNTYTRIDTLGNKLSDEYNGDVAGWARSLFIENRSPANDKPEPKASDELDNMVDNMVRLSESPDNQFKNLGMPQEGGGYEVAEQMLERIQSDPGIDQRLKTVASILQGSGETTIASDRLADLISNPKFSVSYGTADNSIIIGQYYTGGKMKLNPAVKNKNVAADTFLHELIHHRTTAIVLLAGFSDKLNNIPEKRRKTAQAIQEKFQNEHPEAVRILTQIDRLRYEALMAFNKKLESEWKDPATIRTQTQKGDYETDDHLMMYGLNNTEEFITHVLTDAKMASFLNSVTNSKNRTFLTEVWDMLSRLLISVSKSLGVNVNKDSVLREALTLTLKLTTLGTGLDANININDAISENTAISVSTQRLAAQIKQGLEANFRKSVDIQDAFTHLSLKVDNKVQSTVDTPPQIVKVLVKLREQEKELKLIIARADTKTVEGQQSKRALQADQRALKEDIEDLRHKVEIGAVAAVGNKQMKWVENIMNKAKPTPQEIAVASKVLDLWSNVGETVYGGQAGLKEYNPELGKLIVDAQAVKTNSFAAKEMEALNHYLSGEQIILTRQDYDSLKDMGSLSQLFRGLETASSRVVSAIALVGKNAAEMRDEDIRTLGLRLGKLETSMLALVGGRKAALPDLYKQFMQENADKTAWGFVQRYSPQWYSYVGSLRSTLENQINRAYDLEGVSRKTAIREAHSKYWNDLNKVSLFVDTRVMFDANTGEILDNEHTVKERALLLKHLGTEEHVNEAIEKAQIKYKKYLEKRDLEYDSIEKTTELTPEEISSIVLSEDEGKLDQAGQAAVIEQKKKDMLAAKIAKKKAEWKGWNSPNVFFDSRYSNDSVNGFGSEEFTVLAPRIKNPHYYDSKYTVLQQKGNEGKRAVLDEMLDIRDELMDALPDAIKNKVGDNFLPNVTKETVRTMLGMISSLKPSSMADKLFVKLTASKEELDRQKTKTSIPIRHIDNRQVHNLSGKEAEQRRQELDNRSKDLPQILDIFGRMALHYKHMSHVLDIVNTGESILKDINRARLNDSSKGEALTKTLTAMEYWKDTLFFKNAKALEGVSSRAMYSANLKKNAALTKEIKDLNARKENLDAKMIDDMLTPEEFTERDTIDKRMQEIATQERHFVASKGADALVSFNQLRTLAFNPFAAVTNVTFAYISLWINANGRKDYTNKTLQQGLKDMRHSQMKYLLFGKVEDATARKIMNSMERSNLLSMTNEATYGESNIKSRQKSTLRKAIGPMNWQLSGDFYTKGALMVAMMRHKMVTLTDGTKVSLWDATGEDGYWNEEKYGKRPDWAADDVEDQKSWNRFKAQLNKVSTMVFGNQDRNSPLLVKKGWLGRLAGQFRLSWLPEGVATRWQPAREDLELGRTVKGRWRTYLDLGVFNSAMVLARQTLAAMPGVNIDPFSGVKDAKGKDISDVDIENMRKNIAGLAWTVAFTVAMLTASHFLLPDEEEKKRRRKLHLSINDKQTRLLLNMLTRNYQDLTLYSSPSVLDTVTGNFIPATAAITDFTKAMGATLNLMTSDPKAYEKWKKKSFKLFPVLANFNKVEYMTTKDVSQIGH